MQAKILRGKALIETFLTTASAYLHFENLGLDPVAIDLGFFTIKWYSLAYLAGTLIGYWYLLKLIEQPGSPMARRHADDMIFYATLGIILGGRMAYVLFYQPAILEHPLDIFQLWQGGMSFHGGGLGVSLRSDEPTSELPPLITPSSAVFLIKKKKS